MTKIEHCRWCIANLPITEAERTIFYFMFGFDSRDSSKYRKYLRKKYYQR